MGSLWTDLYCNKEFFKQALTTAGDSLSMLNLWMFEWKKAKKKFKKSHQKLTCVGVKWNVIFYSILFYSIYKAISIKSHTIYTHICMQVAGQETPFQLAGEKRYSFIHCQIVSYIISAGETRYSFIHCQIVSCISSVGETRYSFIHCQIVSYISSAGETRYSFIHCQTVSYISSAGETRFSFLHC
jgi:hypothetical protein